MVGPRLAAVGYRQRDDAVAVDLVAVENQLRPVRQIKLPPTFREQDDSRDLQLDLAHARRQQLTGPRELRHLDGYRLSDEIRILPAPVGKAGSFTEEIGKKRNGNDDLQLLVVRVEGASGNEIKKPVLRIAGMQSHRGIDVLFPVRAVHAHDRCAARYDSQDAGPGFDRLDDRKSFRLFLIDGSRFDFQPVEARAAGHCVIEEGLRSTR